MDAAQAQGYAPEYLAEVVREALIVGDNEVVIAPWHHRAFAMVRHLLPAAYFKIMEGRARSNRKAEAKSQ